MSTGTQTEVVMPQMGVSVSEGTITKWLKQVGDTVVLDEPLLEISTDKVDTEVPSPGAGTVTQILVQEGQTVDVGTLLAVIGPGGTPPTDAEPAPVAPAATPEAPAGAVTTAQPAPVLAAAAPAPPAASAPSAADGTAEGNGRSFVSPVVARIAAEHGVNPSTITGTGTGGRVTKKDILAFIANGGAQPAAAPQPAAVSMNDPPVAEPVAAVSAPAVSAASVPPAAPAAPVVPAVPAAAPVAPPAAAPSAAAPTAAVPSAQAPAATALPGETVEPMTAMRRMISEHMRRSLDTSAHVTNVSEIDLTGIAGIRRALKPTYEGQGVNLTFLAFVARATVDALAEWPWLNSEIRGESIVTRNFVNLGIAVSLEGGKGLIVPVIRNAQDLNLLGTARAIQDLAARARSKKLLPDDVQGGTITITNPGGYGTLMGTPIISQPQVANIGVYAIQKRAVVVEDEHGNDSIAIRSMMYLTVTYDHRLIDGAYAAQFGRDIKTRLESWEEPGA